MHNDTRTTMHAAPGDLCTRAVNLDGDGVAYVEHVEGRVELTVKMRGRLNVALTLFRAKNSQRLPSIWWQNITTLIRMLWLGRVCLAI